MHIGTCLLRFIQGCYPSLYLIYQCLLDEHIEKNGTMVPYKVPKKVFPLWLVVLILISCYTHLGVNLNS